MHEFYLYRFIAGISFIIFGMIGKPTPLDEAPNNATFVYLLGVWFMITSLN